MDLLWSFINIILGFLGKSNDEIRKLDRGSSSDLPARSASSFPFHLIRKKSSPGSLVEPIILSAVSLRANPRGLLSSLSFFFFSLGSSFLAHSDFLFCVFFSSFFPSSFFFRLNSSILSLYFILYTFLLKD